jgi:hypothetical protein
VTLWHVSFVVTWGSGNFLCSLPRASAVSQENCQTVLVVKGEKLTEVHMCSLFWELSRFFVSTVLGCRLTSVEAFRVCPLSLWKPANDCSLARSRKDCDSPTSLLVDAKLHFPVLVWVSDILETAHLCVNMQEDLFGPQAIRDERRRSAFDGERH